MACVRISRLVALVALLSFHFLAIFVAPANSDCYTPDGKPWYYHQECYSPTVGAMTSCCHTLDKCLDNLLCAHVDDAGNQTYYRGSCSNSPDWSEETCPNFCKGHTEADSHLGDWPVGKCPGESVDRWFCIGNETGYGTVDDCADPAFGFTLDGDTSTFWTAGIMRTNTPEPETSVTSNVPGTSTRISWKGGITTSSLSTTAISIEQQRSTSVLDAPSPTSEDNPTSSLVIATPSSTLADPSTSTYENQLTTPASADQSFAPLTETPSSIVSNAPDILTSSVPSSITLAPPPMLTTPRTTVTVQPSPTGNTTDTGGTQSKTVPIAVGVSVGTVVLLTLAAIAFLCVRNRHRKTLARAETPPPYEPERQPEQPERRRFSWENK